MSRSRILAELFPGAKILDASPWAIPGCSGKSVTTWETRASALWAKRYLDLHGCGHPGCSRRHKVHLIEGGQ